MKTIKEITGKVEQSINPEREASAEGNFYKAIAPNSIGPGMNKRIQRLRKLSFDAQPSISIERALHQTAFYKEFYGKYSIPVHRALTFLDHCKKKTLYFSRLIFWSAPVSFFNCFSPFSPCFSLRDNRFKVIFIL